MSRVLKRNWIPAAGVVAYIVLLYWVANLSAAPRQWFASPSGSGTACTIGSPCTLAYIFHTAKPASGDSVEIRAGTYSPTSGSIGGKLAPEWSGTATAGCSNYQPCANDIIIEAYNHEHVVVDCNVNVSAQGSALCIGAENAGNGNYVQWRNIDVTNSNNGPRWINQSGSNLCTNAAQCNNGVVLSGTGVKIINCWVHDNYNGIQNSGSAACGVFVYGTGIYNNGIAGSDRGHGHALYVENQYSQGETCRAWFQDNWFRNQMDIDIQAYSAGSSTIAYQTFDHNVSGCTGHAAYPTLTWPTCGLGLSPAIDLYGTQGSIATSCLGSDKVALNGVINGHMMFSDKTGQMLTIGYTKGSCNFQVTNSYIAGAGSPIGFTNNATFGTLTITGNTFFGTPNGSGGPAPVFNSTNYPTNTYNSGLPAAGSANQIFYRSNQYETGRGFAAIYDWHNDTNVSIDLCQMGGFNGEQYQLFNWMDPEPHTGTAVATGTITGCPTPFNVSVPIAAPTIATISGDGTIGAPPDSGLQWFTTYLLYPNWTAPAGTPTPTNTNTPTSTNTPTNTPTATNTNTPLPTNTPTNTNTPINTNTPTFTPTPTRTPTAAVNSLRFGVNNCTAEAPMTITADSTAVSGNHASSTVVNQGDLVCQFNVPADGTYRVWVHVSATAFTADSFFLDVDGDNSFFSLTPTPTPVGNTPTPTGTPSAATGHTFSAIEQIQPCGDPNAGACVYSNNNGWPTNGFIWNMMNDRQSVCPAASPHCSGNFTERDVTLTVAGNPHYLTFRNREAGGGEGARLDYFVLTTDLNSEPPNIGTPTPTPNPYYCKQLVRCKQQQGYKNMPCPLVQDGAVYKNNIPCPWK